MTNMRQHPLDHQNLLQSAYSLTSVDSIIRELIENSLDSNSSYVDIHVDIRDAIKIKFKDNGDGILFDVMNSLSERYISTKRFNEDSGKITTLGFRGEALCSIISLSEVVKIFSPNGFVEYKNGSLVESDNQGKIEKGTAFFIEDPFCKIPIRKNIILNSIFKIFGRITNLVSEYYIFNKVELRLNLSSANKEKSHIFPLSHSLTKKLTIIHPLSQFEESNAELDSCKISYVLGNSDYRYIAINSRPIFWKKLVILLKRTEENLDKKLVLFNVTINSGFDLNIEPDKRVPFIAEEARILKDVADFLATIRISYKVFDQPIINRTNLKNNSDKNEAGQTSSFERIEAEISPKLDFIGESIAEEVKSTSEGVESSIWNDDTKSYANEKIESSENCNLDARMMNNQNLKISTDFTFTVEDFESFDIIGNFNRSFIMLKIKKGKVFIVDQHAADERVNLELLERNFSPDVQTLLQPTKCPIELHLEELAMEYRKEIEKLYGFKYEIVDEELILSKAPKIADEVLKINHLIEILHDIRLTKRPSLRSSAHIHSFLATKACKMSIRLGESIDNEKMSRVTSSIMY